MPSIHCSLVIEDINLKTSLPTNSECMWIQCPSENTVNLVTVNSKQTVVQNESSQVHRGRKHNWIPLVSSDSSQPTRYLLIFWHPAQKQFSSWSLS